MAWQMRLYEDVLSARQTLTLARARPRAIYVAAGAIEAAGRAVASDDGFVSVGQLEATSGDGGACLWRWEIAPASCSLDLLADQSTLKLQPVIFDHAVDATHLLRLDSVAFPPGGCAYLHTHQGPGIRCLIEGRIRIDTVGHACAYGPGSPWFEAGPEPVFAQADDNVATRFIRAMALPRELVGKSSIRYVRAEDKDKPKSQTYHVFDEQLLSD